MKLVVKCPKCKTRNEIKKTAATRPEFARQYGDTHSITCKKCHHSFEYHVDDIRAVPYSFKEIIVNRLIIWVGLSIISLLIGIFLFKLGIIKSILFWFIIIIVSILFKKKNNSSAILTFNKHKLKGRVSNVNLKR